jgi:hypothetical protein
VEIVERVGGTIDYKTYKAINITERFNLSSTVGGQPLYTNQSMAKPTIPPITKPYSFSCGTAISEGKPVTSAEVMVEGICISTSPFKF